MALFLILLGLATFCYVDLIGLDCGMGPRGCAAKMVYLYFRHLTEPEGVIYLFVMTLALLILVAGLFACRGGG